MRLVSLILMLCVLAAHAPMIAQTAAPVAAAPVTPLADTAVPAPPIGFALTDGTPVKLRTNRNLSSADSKTGDTIDFEVLEDVKIGDIVVIPRGGRAIGSVTHGKPKGHLGRGGRLDIAIESVRTTTGDKVALKAKKETKGHSGTTGMTTAIVASSILFFPAAPFFLFLKGKDIKIPKGTEVIAYVAGDSVLDAARYAAGAPTVGSSDASSTVVVKSDPDGAEITIDGKFVGNAPSTVQLAPGDHAVLVTKTGYAAWERTITSTAGSNVNVNAELTKVIRP